MNFSHFPSAPPPADPESGARRRERWLEAAAELADSGLAAFMAEVADTPLLSAVFGASPFLSQCLIQEPATVQDLAQQGPDQVFAELLAELIGEGDKESDQARLMTRLRQAKRRISLLVALADIGGAWTLEAVTAALSTFAETAITLSCRCLLRRAHQRGELALPHPDDPDRECGLIVLGMGKLGAGELNYSSDIDLIVLYDHERIDYRGTRSLPEAMIALTRELVRCLDERTADGYVFRTDLRLRPDPGATPLAISTLAAEAYYEGFGQNWERAAMIKARPVGGDRAAGQDFIRFLKPFIWRKSLDFAAIQDIHAIKRQINAHHGGRSIAVAGHNIKLGRGGIREIEFFVQTQQLIRGGRQPELRQPATLAALSALATAGHIESGVEADLAAAYRFLRALEHRLQMIDDQQTQTLPGDGRRLDELARFFGLADASALATALTVHLQTVERHYARLFEDSPSLGAQGNLVFTGGENDPETLRTLSDLGFVQAEAVCSTIRGWHHGRVRATRSPRARELLTELTPALLAAMATTARPDDAFLRFDDFLGRLPTGIALFSLFHANPSLLDLVAEIMGNAPLLALHLARHPSLLDSVLDAGFLDPLPPPPQLAAELEQVLAEATDFQDMLDLCRRWANDRKFQVGIQILRCLIDPQQAAAAFTAIADTVLAQMAARVAGELARAHGSVPGGAWCLLAMGKMGGGEMTVSSDLDLILIYDAPEQTEESDGPRPLAVSTWYARFTQRLVTALTAPTGEGALYEVDMRLRPSGNSGPIASSLTAFGSYQRDSAWTWEHMALTRARVVAGDQTLASKVRTVIAETLTRRRDTARLLTDVADMRERMAAQHRAANHWQVKHMRGGLVDIEFIAQTLQLAHAADRPDILATNTRQALDRAAAAGLLAPGDHDLLVDAWTLWSAIQLVLRQTIAGEFDDRSAPQGLKDLLARAAGLVDFHSMVDRIDDLAAQSLAVFRRLIPGA